MEKKYLALEKRLDKLNFKALWPGFKRFNFALYDGKDVYLNKETKPWDHRFLGCTAIKYNDEFIAIWDLRLIPQDYDLDILCANIVHEMFHCFQLEKKETKYPNEILGLDYPLLVENQVLRYEEVQYLNRAFLEEDEKLMRRNLNHFMSCRLKREKILGNYIEYEYGLESFEGIPRYVEYKALAQLTSEEYSQSTYLNHLEEINSKLLIVRHNCFAPGMLIACILDRLKEGWKDNFIDQKKYSFEILKEFFNIEEVEIKTDEKIKSQFETLIDKRKEEIKELFDSVLKHDHQKIKGNYQLTGFDPMNAVKVGNQVYHQYFLKIKEDDNEITYEGPIISVHSPEQFFSIEEVNILS